MKFGQWPLSDVSDQMVAMSKMSDKPNGRDARNLISLKLGNRKRERGIYRAVVKNGPLHN